MGHTKNSEREDTLDARMDGMAQALSRPPPGSRKRKPSLSTRTISEATRERLRELRPTHTLAYLGEMFSISRSSVKRLTHGITGPVSRRRHAAFTPAVLAEMRRDRPTHALVVLARRYHTTDARIAEFCRGIEGPPTKRRVIPKEMIEAMRRDRRAGLSIGMIAAKYDVGTTSVWRLTAARSTE